MQIPLSTIQTEGKSQLKSLCLQMLLSSDAKTSKSKLSTNREFRIDTSLVKSEFEKPCNQKEL